MRRDHYFAYGSNLSFVWLRERVASALTLGVARAPGFALRLDKRGADGSAKANLRADPGETTWGVVYTLDADHWPHLDACERGYERIAIEVWLDDAPARVLTYSSRLRTEDPVAFGWYKRLLVEGAREHGLPADWQARLAALPSRPPEEREPPR